MPKAMKPVRFKLILVIHAVRNISRWDFWDATEEEERRRSITVALFYVISPPSTCSHSGNVCKRVRERERERDPITCLSQDDSSVCGKALHPLAFTFPHPNPNLPPAKGKIAQLAKAITERQGIYSLCFHSTPRSTFLGRWSSPPRPPWRTGDG